MSRMPAVILYIIVTNLSQNDVEQKPKRKQPKPDEQWIFTETGSVATVINVSDCGILGTDVEVKINGGIHSIDIRYFLLKYKHKT